MKDFIIPDLDEKTQKKLLGIQGLFLKGEKRESYLASKIVDYTIKEYKKAGKELTKDQIDKIKFAYDPVFKQNIIDKVHKDADREYTERINRCEADLNSLQNAREKEIKRIADSRWQRCEIKEFKYNITEGKALINSATVLFSDIKGAEIKVNESYRTETEHKGKAKKHGSLGGAIVGGALGGGIGAAIGGATLGKTKYKGKTETEVIPTASYVGVVIDINGFKSEFAIMTKTVDQDSHHYKKSMETAQAIVAKLQQLAQTPVPEAYLLPEEEQSVLNLDNDICFAMQRLEQAKANTPKYEIPERYL